MICTAKTKRGTACQSPAIKGANVCRKHGGAAPAVKARAAIRAELINWRLSDVADDPGEVLLRLVTQSRRRAEAYALELERVAALSENLSDALIGDSLITGADGTVHKAGEYLRGIVELEAAERDRCYNFAVKAVAAGLAERQVRVAEAQAVQVAQLIRHLVSSPELGLTPVQREAALRVASRELRALPAA
jgi:hypothetical protein